MQSLGWDMAPEIKVSLKSHGASGGQAEHPRGRRDVSGLEMGGGGGDGSTPPWVHFAFSPFADLFFIVLEVEASCGFRVWSSSFRVSVAAPYVHNLSA